MDHANVCTSRTSKSQTRINCLVFTDRDGRFQIERLKVGTYGLFEVKEEEGYTALNQGPREKIKITAERSSAMVTIRMSPRGGILIGSVKDKATGKPIHEARVM